jgi:hypothetical protein
MKYEYKLVSVHKDDAHKQLENVLKKDKYNIDGIHHTRNNNNVKGFSFGWATSSAGLQLCFYAAKFKKIKKVSK